MDGSKRGLISCIFLLELPDNPLLLDMVLVNFYSSKRGGVL
jgi:hypothetical protein